MPPRTPHNKPRRQRLEHRQLLARLEHHEGRRQRLRTGGAGAAHLEAQLVGVQRKIDRTRRVAKMPPVDWLALNRDDRALRRRLSTARLS